MRQVANNFLHWKDTSLPQQHLTGKRICLTGGTDGIGLALAKRLIAEKADVLVIGRRSHDDLSLPQDCHYCQADLSKPESIQSVLEHLAALKWDDLNHLIHNASMGYVGPFEDQPTHAIETMIQLNLKTPMDLTHAAFKLLERAGGSVCFIGSTVAGRTTPEFALYTATKTALADFAHNLRIEWNGRVQVQEVHPGPTRTGFHKKSGLANPPMVWAFMSPDEAAKGIIKSLKSGKKIKKYAFPSLLLHALLRTAKGERP